MLCFGCRAVDLTLSFGRPEDRLIELCSTPPEQMRRSLLDYSLTGEVVRYPEPVMPMPIDVNINGALRLILRIV